MLGFVSCLLNYISCDSLHVTLVFLSYYTTVQQLVQQIKRKNTVLCDIEYFV